MGPWRGMGNMFTTLNLSGFLKCSYKLNKRQKKRQDIKLLIHYNHIICLKGEYVKTKQQRPKDWIKICHTVITINCFYVKVHFYKLSTIIMFSRYILADLKLKMKTKGDLLKMQQCPEVLQNRNKSFQKEILFLPEIFLSS